VSPPNGEGGTVPLLLENLKAFNRKERFFVVGWALDNPTFRVGNKFRKQVAKDTGLHIPVEAFCAMDFHMDWILGCLYVTKEERATYEMLETGEVNQNNEDVDLVVAYEAGDKTHLMLIEAKGVTGWNNAQLRHKAKRLGKIFGTGQVTGRVTDRWPGVEPHWILASAASKKPEKVDVSDWPAWMKPGGQLRWLELPLPSGLRKIVRCDKGGKKNAAGVFWRVA
jgi:hypothetical protein